MCRFKGEPLSTATIVNTDLEPNDVIVAIDACGVGQTDPLYREVGKDRLSRNVQAVLRRL